MICPDILITSCMFFLTFKGSCENRKWFKFRKKDRCSEKESQLAFEFLQGELRDSGFKLGEHAVFIFGKICSGI